MRPLLDVEQLDGGFKPPPVPPGFVLTKLPPGLSLIQTIESERGPWDVGGTYGRILSVPFPTRLDESPIAIFSCDRQLGPPRPRTLNLFRNDAQVSGGGNADFYASITYGVGGVINNFLCDWSRGGQISLVCQTLRVDAIAYQPVGTSAYSPPTGLQTLGAMLGHVGSAPPKPPTFTTQRTTVATGNFVDFAVPDFARWVYPGLGSYMPLDAAPVNISLECLNLGGQALKLSQYTERMQLEGVQLPGGTTEVRINNSAGFSVTPLLSFELGL